MKSLPKTRLETFLLFHSHCLDFLLSYSVIVSASVLLPKPEALIVVSLHLHRLPPHLIPGVIPSDDSDWLHLENPATATVIGAAVVVEVVYAHSERRE